MNRHIKFGCHCVTPRATAKLSDLNAAIIVESYLVSHFEI